MQLKGKGDHKPFKGILGFDATGGWCVEIHALKDLQEQSNHIPMCQVKKKLVTREMLYGDNRQGSYAKKGATM